MGFQKRLYCLGFDQIICLLSWLIPNMPYYSETVKSNVFWWLEWEDACPYCFSFPPPFVLCDVSDFISPHAPTVMVNLMDGLTAMKKRWKNRFLLLLIKFLLQDSRTQIMEWKIIAIVENRYTYSMNDTNTRFLHELNLQVIVIKNLLDIQ